MVVQPGLCQTWSETMKTGFLATRLISLYISEIESALLCSQCTSGPNGTCVTSPPSATKCPHSTHNVNCMTTKTYNDNGKTLFACWVILHAFLSSADFSFKLSFFLFQKINQEYDQSVKQFGSRSCLTFLRSDLDQNCLQISSVDGTSRERVECIKKKNIYIYMSHVVRKPAFCICENKDADQLRGNREADQRLCFLYIDSTIPLLSKSEISSL